MVTLACIVILLVGVVELSAGLRRTKRDAACYPNIDNPSSDTCFPNEAPYLTTERQVPLPDDPRKDGVFYYLFTRGDADPQTLDARDLTNMTGSWTNIRNRLTSIIIHGMVDAQYPNQTVWMTEMSNQLLIRDESNVILVDWSNSSTTPYPQAVSNARVMGALVAQLIRTIKKVVGVQESNIHLIGHDLGAHVAGYVGQLIPGIGRISGLDPSGPLFENTPAKVRLDPSDATFVDVIHTDIRNYTIGGGFGIVGPIGHKDFYPNLGYQQPGCDSKEQDEYSCCDHRRAYEFFIASINSECGFISFPCDNDEDYVTGKCHPCGQKGCSAMGYNSVLKQSDSELLVKYFLRTSDDKPYCLIHVDFTFEVRGSNDNDSSAYQQRLNVNASIKGDNQNTTDVALSKEPLNFQPGKSYNFTAEFPDHQDKLRSIELRLVDIQTYKNETSFGNMTSELDLVSIRISTEPFGLSDVRELCDGNIILRVNDTVIISKDCNLP